MSRLVGLLVVTCVVIVVLMFRIDGDAVSQPAASQPAFVGPICVAILEPEILADLPIEQRKALAGAIDTLLTESLSGREAFILVDRQLLDKVLDEHKARAAGAAKVAPSDVAESLRPFWSAGVLVCSQIDSKGGAVMVEAVSAQTGQLLGELYLRGNVGSADGVAKLVEPKLQVFADSVLRGVARAQDKPLLEISGRLTGGLTRMAWMVDDLTDAAGARVVASDKAAWLVPRQPLVTKEERLLRVMGLGAAREGDAAAGLSPVPQMRLTFELEDSAKIGVAFDKTPISLKLSLQRGQDKPLEMNIDGLAGEWDVCRERAAAWLCSQMAALEGPGTASSVDEESRARKLAEEELSAVAQWGQLREDQQTVLGVELRSRIARHALRAAHLDPASEPAAFLVARTVDALYPLEGKNRDEMSLAAIDRCIAEARRYLDRFKQKEVEHHREILTRLGTLGVHGVWKFNRGGRKDDLLREPDIRLYPYASVFVRAWAEYGYLGNVDKRYDNSNSFSAFSFNLLSRLIPCIPADRLAEEHEYWRNFYATKVKEVMDKKRHTDFNNTRPAPWELIDAAFHARMKDPQAVRANLQLLAKQFPHSQTHVWGGDQWTPPRVPLLLQAAGDSEWRTWQPSFQTSEQVRVDINAMTAFMAGLSPISQRVWDYAGLPVMAGAELSIPAQVRQAGEVRGADYSRSVTALAIAGGDLWVITPGMLAGTGGVAQRLFVITGGRGGTAEATEMSWPAADKLEGWPIIACHYISSAGDGQSVWIGTRQHGLARFDRQNGRWVGRWYNNRHGMPSNSVSRITRCMGEMGEELLVLDENTRRMYGDERSKYNGPQLTMWAFRPSDGRVTLLHDGSKDQQHFYCPVVKLAGGKRVLLAVSGEGAYEHPVRLADIRSLERGKINRLSTGRIPCTIGPDGWRLIWELEGSRIQPYDPITLAPVGGGPGKSSAKMVSAAVAEVQVRDVLGMIAARPSSKRNVSSPSWPAVRYVVYAVGRGDTLWMVFNEGTYWDHCRHMVGYRPAPPGTKDWASADAWIGPFATPGQELVYGLEGEGRTGLLLSTLNHVLHLDSEKLFEQARQAGLIRSTQQWRSEFQARAAKGNWQAVVPLMIAGGQYEQAGALLDKRSAELDAAGAEAGAANNERLRLLLWKARFLADQKNKLAEAIDLYDRVASDPKAGLPAEVFARANQIILLHRAGRWQELLDMAERVQKRFIQMKEGRGPRGLAWYIADARKRLSASTQPAADEGED
jgi:hypothetical protein